MRTHQAKPSPALPHRLLEIQSFDANSWLNHHNGAAPHFNHLPTAPPGKIPDQINDIDRANAIILERCRALRNERHVWAAEAVAELTRGVVHIAYFLHKRRSDAPGFIAVINLIDDGILIPVEHGLFTRQLRVLATTHRSTKRGGDHA